MIVGIDIDGVLGDYVLDVTAHSGMLPTSIATTYDMIEPALFESRDHWRHKHTSFVETGGFRNMTLLDITAASSIQKMRDAGVEVHIVTARTGFGTHTDDQVFEDTLEWLHENDITFDKFVMSSDKSSTKANWMLDDSPYNISSMLSTDTTPVAYRQLYNSFGNGVFDCSTVQYVDSVSDYADLVLSV